MIFCKNNKINVMNLKLTKKESFLKTFRKVNIAIGTKNCMLCPRLFF